MNILPGFESYLRRTFKEEFENETIKDPVPSTTKTEEHSSEGITVVDVQNSSSISRLEYNAASKELTTTYKHGNTYTDVDVSPEVFDRVAHPGQEFQGSVGKAHHALIRGRSKRK